MVSREARRNAYLYCKFRDEQYDLYDQYAKEHGLSMKSFLVINALYYAKNGMTQKEICARTFNSKQTVNLIVKGLKKEQSVEVTPDQRDKRTTIVTMTEEGRSRYGAVVLHITESEDQAMAMLTEEEQEQIVCLSRRFTQYLCTLVKGDE